MNFLKTARTGNNKDPCHVDIDKQQKMTADESQEYVKEKQKYLAIARQVSPMAKRQVIIWVDSVELICDLDLLQLTTEYFESGTPGMVYVLPSDEVKFVPFVTIYKWMSLPNDIVPPKLLMGVYRAARFLKIDVLVKQFDEKIRDPLTAREEIGFYMCYGLHQMKLDVPFHKTLHVHRYFLTMVGTPEFLMLWPTALIGLLSSSSVCVNSEMEVLIAAMMWLDYDYKNRHGYAMQLFSCVRFDSIPLEALMQFRYNEFHGYPLTEMLFLPQFERFVKSAPSINNNTRYCKGRIWIYDPQCAYHHDAHCPQRNFITMKMFMDFQKVLRNAPQLHWWHRQQLNPYKHNCRHEQCRRLRGRGYAPETETTNSSGSINQSDQAHQSFATNQPNN